MNGKKRPPMLNDWEKKVTATTKNLSGDFKKKKLTKSSGTPTKSKKKVAEK
jgi:hypothetical protein